MCNCTGTCSGSCVIDLTGIGQKGDTGAQGGYGGYSSAWTFNTTTTSGTTAGQLRLNSATYASVTTIYINKTNKNSTDMSNFLATFSNGTYYGKIRVFKESDSSKFWEGSITAVSSGATEYTLTVTYILANSTFAASDSVVVTFTPHGQGAKPILYSALGNFTSATTGSWVTPSSCTFTIPAGLLTTAGDYVEVIILGDLGISGSAFDYNCARCMINGTSIVSMSPGYDIGYNDIVHHASAENNQNFIIKIIIERIDDTNVQDTTIVIVDGMYSHAYTANAYTVNSLAASTNTFEVQIYQDSSTSSAFIKNIKAIKYLQ